MYIAIYIKKIYFRYWFWFNSWIQFFSTKKDKVRIK